MKVKENNNTRLFYYVHDFLSETNIHWIYHKLNKANSSTFFLSAKICEFHINIILQKIKKGSRGEIRAPTATLTRRP